ncbi:MAG: hypothetical protein JOY90_03400 [Bradyrhizobium sp.]|uniref:hypothetical protein n=1 Tax=Bradyrhizobium sp. TaxID=376 RepID=UPI001D548AAD|nr:hypothetical protein [Bradyrhizobium sp.]MBV9559497.1 hypothetical protein [Bradyrhizobium sp.]
MPKGGRLTFRTGFEHGPGDTAITHSSSAGTIVDEDVRANPQAFVVIAVHASDDGAQGVRPRCVRDDFKLVEDFVGRSEGHLQICDQPGDEALVRIRLAVGCAARGYHGAKATA